LWWDHKKQFHLFNATNEKIEMLKVLLRVSAEGSPAIVSAAGDIFGEESLRAIGAASSLFCLPSV
jgi:hypothetical protein